MHLSRLKAINLRNLVPLDIEPSHEFTLFYGVNGSGKTSILEAIYLLSRGSSFRTNITNRMIAYDADSFTVFGSILDDSQISTTIGIERNATGKVQLKVNGEPTATLAELANLLPLQIINPDSYQLLNQGPKFRRAFIDWGVFHVEHGFFTSWQRFQRILKQRNSCLQQQMPASQVKAWDTEFVHLANQITFMRDEYLKGLTPIALEVLNSLIDLQGLTLAFHRGWGKDKELVEVLADNFFQDMRLGYTQYGPQRCDLVLRVNGEPAQDVLSRGEQKLLVLALRLAQGLLLKQRASKHCLYLIDDLAAELDPERRKLVLDTLMRLEAQVFITAVEEKALGELQQFGSVKMFHVEQGNVLHVK